LVGIDHVALEVGSLDEAIAWYGDQFLALAEVAEPHRDAERHFGLVVDVPKAAVRAALEAAGVETTEAPNLTFRDPWDNAVQIVFYDEITFEKSERWLHALGLGG
jgi:catechol 2,3-dioxygenase-like lactoylglutathione lyase family enzyme